MSSRSWPGILAIAVTGVMLVSPTIAVAQEASPSPAAVENPTASTLKFEPFDEVELLTAESGQGIRPLLEWEPVEGAASYTVYLYTPSGEPYWVWFGAETAIHVGGEPQLREGAPGPSVAEGMSWLVISYDEDGVPIGMSSPRAISP